MGLEDGSNPYAYAGSNPVMNVDPSGLMIPLSLQEMGNTYVQNNLLNQAINNFERNLTQIKLNQPPYQSPSILAPTPKYTSNGKNYYRTMDEAGIAAIQSINPTSIKLGVEFAGLIGFSSLGYSYSTPSSGNIDTSFPLLSYLSNNGVLVGNYHTHGSWTPAYGKGNEYFSKSDRGYSIYAQALYLGTPTGAIKKWMPSWDYQLNLSTGKKEPFLW